MKTSLVVGFLLTAAIPMCGADADPVKFFKLDFTAKELDGSKIVSSHTYSVRAATGQPGLPGFSSALIRTGSKIPSNNSYVEVGINFDIRHFKEVDGDVSMELVADISSMVEDPAEKTRMPVIRQNKWNSVVSAKVGKPTVVFSSDDVSSKHQMTVELTATPVR